MLAVEVLVEAVVVANAILQEQRRRARLAGMDLRALVTKAPPGLVTQSGLLGKPRPPIIGVKVTFQMFGV